MILRGTRCHLRDWQPADVARFEHWLQPEHDWHQTNGPYFPKPDAAGIEALVADRTVLAAASESELPVPRDSLVIVPADDPDRLVGTVNWYWESRATDWRRLGIAIYDPAVRGRGVGTDALRLWTGYLFSVTDALRLDLATYSGNVAMARAALAAGFVEEARMRRARRWSGGVHDALVFGVLRDEFAGTTG